MGASRRPRSLRTGIRIAYVVLAAIALFGITLNVVTFRSLMHERSRLSDQLDPGAIAVERWFAAIIDQQNGLRGYALTGSAEFLEPWFESREIADGTEYLARRDLWDHAHLLELVDRVDELVDRWQREVSEPMLVAIGNDGAGAVGAEELRGARESFAELRDGFDELLGAVQAERTDARITLDRRNRVLGVTSTVSTAFFVLALAGTWFVLNNRILYPLGRLREDARRIADGELDHRLEPTGPVELRHLGADVESMRERIISELAIVRAAREQLIEQAADLERSNQELEQFAYVASHDLQEPLRKVTGFCQLLQRRYADQLDERAEEYIALAVDGAKRMSVLINDLLRFSRVGRTTTSFEPIDLDQLVDEALAVLGDPITDAGVTVERGPLPTVTGDRSLLAVVFQNLIGNAVKFGGLDQPVVEIGCVDGEDEWTISVSDRGIGIDPAYAEQVFVIFQRLHTRDAYEGTGIGLAMSRKIIEFHGGSIWIEARDPAPGTRICFTLPHEPPLIDPPVPDDPALHDPAIAALVDGEAPPVVPAPTDTADADTETADPADVQPGDPT